MAKEIEWEKLIGKVHKTEKEEIKLSQIIGIGAQGAVFEGENTANGKSIAVKIFKEKTPDLVERINFLVDKKLNNETLIWPESCITDKDYAGYTMQFKPKAMTLNDWIENENKENVTLDRCFVMALGIARAVELLHDENIAHGDLSSFNILVDESHGFPKPFLMDFDNFYSDNVALPELTGHENYISPELMDNPEKHPEMSDDLFSLAVIIHEILLMSHPFYDSEKGVLDEEKISKGIWCKDPVYGSQIGALPPNMLNTKILNCFRRSFSANPDIRTKAKELVYVLHRALYDIYKCDCGFMEVAEFGKKECNNCGEPYPNHTFKIKNALQLDLNKNENKVYKNFYLIKKGPEILWESDTALEINKRSAYVPGFKKNVLLPGDTGEIKLAGPTSDESSNVRNFILM